MRYLIIIVLFSCTTAYAEGTLPPPTVTVFNTPFTIDSLTRSNLDTIQILFRDRLQILFDDFSLENVLVVDASSDESLIEFTMDPASTGPFSSFGVISYDLADWGDTVYLILRMFTVLPACFFSIRLLFTGT